MEETDDDEIRDLVERGVRKRRPVDRFVLAQTVRSVGNVVPAIRV